jgi:hypothetical protein
VGIRHVTDELYGIFDSLAERRDRGEKDKHQDPSRISSEM